MASEFRDTCRRQDVPHQPPVLPPSPADARTSLQWIGPPRMEHPRRIQTPTQAQSAPSAPSETAARFPPVGHSASAPNRNANLQPVGRVQSNHKEPSRNAEYSPKDKCCPAPSDEYQSSR